MNARRQPIKAAGATVLAPMSATAAELLHRLLQEAADAVAAAPGTVVLAPHGAPYHHGATNNSAYAYFDNFETAIKLYRFHGDTTPFWTGYEKRLDASGRTWERHVNAVVDNFGDLVEVPA